MPTQLKQTTIVSTKGQMILPKAVRDRLGWGPGTRLSVEEVGGGVVLKPESPFEPTTMDEVFGILHRPGATPVPVEDMDARLEAALRDTYGRD